MSSEKFRIKGYAKKTLVVYEDRAVIETAKGFFNTLADKVGEKSFPYGAIASIEYKAVPKGITTGGYIKFVLKGGGATPLGFIQVGNGISAAIESTDHKIDFIDHKQNPEILDVKNFIEKQISLANQSSGTNNGTPSQADELRKFKQLLDDGIISQEEFEEKKKKLL